MELQKGDRVRHPAMPEWGLGEVLEEPRGDTVRVFFAKTGEKRLSLRHITLIKVPAGEATDPVLDNLHLPQGATAIKYRSVTESKNYFLQGYPGGFSGKRYLEEERNYKLRAHSLANELLDHEQLLSLTEEKAFEEVCQRALRLVNATNLIFPNEKMALRDGLSRPGTQELFGIALGDLLHGRSAFSERFGRFSKVLDELHCAKWTIATYLPFLLYPDTHIFIKPTVTQHAAELCRFAINYNPQLNWLTYKSVLDFAEYLHDQIADLDPRDMIDVQSFMWCIAP